MSKTELQQRLETFGTLTPKYQTQALAEILAGLIEYIPDDPEPQAMPDPGREGQA